jgi:tetratricopeptide (TPR) repeat protein
VAAIEDDSAAVALLDEADGLARLAGDPELVARVQYWLGVYRVHTGELREARARLEESLTRHREAGSLWDVARPLGYLGVLALLEGQYAVARRHLDEAQALLHEADNPAFAAIVLGYLTRLAWAEGDVAHLREWGEAWLASRRDLGDHAGAARALVILALAAWERGDVERARARLVEALHRARGRGDALTVAGACAGIAALACGAELNDAAANLATIAGRLMDGAGLPGSPADRIDHARVVALLAALPRTAAPVALPLPDRARIIDDALAVAGVLPVY